jgi:hypothetical protein
MGSRWNGTYDHAWIAMFVEHVIPRLSTHDARGFFKTCRVLWSDGWKRLLCELFYTHFQRYVSALVAQIGVICEKTSMTNLVTIYEHEMCHINFFRTEFKAPADITRDRLRLHIQSAASIPRAPDMQSKRLRWTIHSAVGAIELWICHGCEKTGPCFRMVCGGTVEAESTGTICDMPASDIITHMVKPAHGIDSSEVNIGWKFAVAPSALKCSKKKRVMRGEIGHKSVHDVNAAEARQRWNDASSPDPKKNKKRKEIPGDDGGHTRACEWDRWEYQVPFTTMFPTAMVQLEPRGRLISPRSRFTDTSGVGTPPARSAVGDDFSYRAGPEGFPARPEPGPFAFTAQPTWDEDTVD